MDADGVEELVGLGVGEGESVGVAGEEVVDESGGCGAVDVVGVDAAAVFCCEPGGVGGGVAHGGGGFGGCGVGGDGAAAVVGGVVAAAVHGVADVAHADEGGGDGCVVGPLGVGYGGGDGFFAVV